MGHPNEDLVRRGYDAFTSGDMDTLRELFHPDIVGHAPGRSHMAGDHQGVDTVLGFFAKTMELTGGNFRVEVHDIVAKRAIERLASRHEWAPSVHERLLGVARMVEADLELLRHKLQNPQGD